MEHMTTDQMYLAGMALAFILITLIAMMRTNGVKQPVQRQKSNQVNRYYNRQSRW